MNVASLNVALLLYLDKTTGSQSSNTCCEETLKNTVAKCRAPEFSHRQHFVSDVT